MAWVPLTGGGADLAQQVLVLGAERVRLTTKERDLLAYFAEHPGRTITRPELLEKVWGRSPSASEEPVYSTVKRLRAKIDRGAHRHIVSVHGDGYRFEPAVATESAQVDEPRPGIATRETFVGRADELARLEAALATDEALVTLVGPGGAGKTRCAQVLGTRHATTFCDLGGAMTEESLFSTLAASLGVPLEGATPSEWSASLRRAIAVGPRRVLVLDNVEQVATAVGAMIASWRPRPAPLLCTSREALLLPDEQVVSIGPLPEEDAISLFRQRLGPDLSPDAERDVCAAIVARVDSLPLAIELAAAQAKEIGARALLESLDHPLATLVVGARGAPSRHATLRATVEWSWSFLSERERVVLRLLSVFSGPFRLAAARAVIDDPDAGAQLASLCRRSLALRVGERFALFSAVRELAQEHAADLAPARARHARHFADEGEAAVRLLDGPGHREAATRLHEARVELWSALENAPSPELRARLALVLDRALGLQIERASSRRAILSGARAGLNDGDLESQLLCAEGRIEGASRDLLDRALALAKTPMREAELRLARAEASSARDPRAACADLEAAWALVERGGSAQLRGRIAAKLGEALFNLGRVEEASTWLRTALALHLEAEDRRATATTSALLAHVVRLETGGSTARELLASAEVAADELGDPLVRARVLLDLGQHLTRVGDQREARRALDEALGVYERVGFARDGAMLHLHVAETLVGVGDFAGALGEALRTWTALGDDVARSTVCEAIACIQLMRHDLAEGERWLEQGLALARERGASRSECTLLGKRGLLDLVRGDFERAWADFDEAVRKNEARGSIAIAGASLVDRAMASFALGRDAAADADLAQARELLHHPTELQPEGRVLFACEPLGRAFAALKRGDPPARVSAAVRAQLGPLLGRDPNTWDVVQRLMDWLVEAIARS